jgi:HEAT repeat protein
MVGGFPRSLAGFRSWALWSLVLSASWAASGCGEELETKSTEVDLAELRADRRVAPLFQGCTDIQSRFYDRDTADPIPFLIEKLRIGEREPLQRAKEELATLGDEAMIALRRFFEEHSSDRFGSPYLENAIDAAGLSESLLARDVFLAGLQQPQEAVRLRAARALFARHVRPEE